MPVAVRIVFAVFAAMWLSLAALWVVAVIRGPRERGWMWGLPWVLARLAGGAFFAGSAATGKTWLAGPAAALMAAGLIGQIVAGRIERRTSP